MKDLERRAATFQTSQHAALGVGVGTGSKGAEEQQGENMSGVIEPERAKAAADARRTKVRKREVHPLALRDEDDRT